MIIKSILDTDLYKLSMMHAVIQKFPDLKVEYTFIDRNNQVYPEDFDKFITREIKSMSSLYLTEAEAEYLSKIYYFPKPFIDFLKGYKFDHNEVSVSQDKDGHLNLKIRGLWYHTILWEVPLLSIISEGFYKLTNQIVKTHDISIRQHDLNKLKEMEAHNAFFSEFGARRRYSYDNQDRIVSLFSQSGNHCFVGTSNVHLAHKYNVKPIGTMAHEWIMAHGALYGYRMANNIALNNWADVYGGNLGIALSDTYTTDVFLRSFDMKLAKLYDGVRHDSGDPYVFADKVIEHYKKLGIDPMSKAIVFSNALDIKTAVDIKEYCVGKIKSSFGIGTHFTNDLPGIKPMNIVIKLSAVWINDEWVPAVKLSDDLGKNTGDSNEVILCKNMLRI